MPWDDDLRNYFFGDDDIFINQYCNQRTIEHGGLDANPERIHVCRQICNFLSDIMPNGHHNSPGFGGHTPWLSVSRLLGPAGNFVGNVRVVVNYHEGKDYIGFHYRRGVGELPGHFVDHVVDEIINHITGGNYDLWHEFPAANGLNNPNCHLCLRYNLANIDSVEKILQAIQEQFYVQANDFGRYIPTVPHSWPNSPNLPPPV